MGENAGWSGQVVVTENNPQRLAPSANDRRAWRAYSLDDNAETGRIGYSDNPDQAYIPMPVDKSYPVGSAVDEGPCETNEIWFHGPVGSTIGFGQA